MKNPAYRRVSRQIERARAQGDRAAVRELQKQLRSLPSQDRQDPGYRRLKYVRYAGDYLLGFIGPKAEAEEIKERLAQFLRNELKLEPSKEKTLITHARTSVAKFLGYEITVQHGDHRLTGKRRCVNGTIGLRVLFSVIKAKCAQYMKRGQPAHRPELMVHDDHTIVSILGSQYRGVVQYYLLAGDVWRLNRLWWVIQTSMLRTLAAKHRSSVMKMARKHGATIETPYGPRRCYEARVERADREPLVATFGGIPLRRQRTAILRDRPSTPVSGRRKELVSRLLAGRCESCEQHSQVEVHQVRRMADLTRPGWAQPAWAQVMARMRRKTLVVCKACHDAIHGRQPATTITA